MNFSVCIRYKNSGLVELCDLFCVVSFDLFRRERCLFCFVPKIVIMICFVFVLFFFCKLARLGMFGVCLGVMNLWCEKNTKPTYTGQDDDEEYRGLSHGETSHIIVWQVHCCWVVHMLLDNRLIFDYVNPFFPFWLFSFPSSRVWNYKFTKN